MALKILKTEPFSPSNFSPYYLVLGLRMQMLSSPDLEANASSMVLKILKTEPFSPPPNFSPYYLVLGPRMQMLSALKNLLQTFFEKPQKNDFFTLKMMF